MIKAANPSFEDIALQYYDYFCMKAIAKVTDIHFDEEKRSELTVECLAYNSFKNFPIECYFSPNEQDDIFDLYLELNEWKHSNNPILISSMNFNIFEEDRFSKEVFIILYNPSLTVIDSFKFDEIL